MNRPRLSADAASLAENTAAVLVVYHGVADVEPVLRRLQAFLGTVLLVDNHEQAHPGLVDVATRLGLPRLHTRNVGGLAGAYNRALAWLRSERGQTTHVVFLDEDSDPTPLPSLLSDAISRDRLLDAGTAALAPAYRDRATGLRGRYIDLGRWRLRFNPREFDDLRPVAFVINSMSVWRMPALQRIGAFDEGLAIDHVDTEYCLRARQLGLQLYVNGRFEFDHAIGERRTYRLFGRELQAGGHGPARRRMIARNTVWLARRWVWREPAFAWLCLTRLAYEAVGIVMAEDQVVAKLAALARGAVAGLLARRLTA